MRGHAGRTAVVTGAAQGIGQAICLRLARDGVDVVAVDLKKPIDTIAAVEATGRRAVPYITDVADPAGIAGLADSVRDEFGGCDVLVNNAGIYPVRTFDE